MTDPPVCLGCGQSFWQHDPDDPDGCELWQPSAKEARMEPEPKKLRDMAWAFDQLTRLTESLYESIARGHDMGASEVTVTVELTDGDGPVSPDTARKLLDWACGTEMQDDLRAWADEIEGRVHQ